MKTDDRFILSVKRNMLDFRNNATPELVLIGNIAELKKLVKIITEAIQYAEEDGPDGFSEDDINGRHVNVTAYIDGVRIKDSKETFNPFETF